MKKIISLICLILLFGINVYGQNDSILNNCTFNMDNGRMTLTGVESINGVNASQLYARALNWIAEKYKNPDYVVKSKDKDAGFIILEGYSIDTDITSRLDLRFKDNKYKWTITDFDFKAGAYAQFGLKDKPLEAVPRYNKKTDDVILQLKKDCKVYIESLRKSMLENKDNW